MGFEIRSYVAADADDLVALALRAWEPVFDSLRTALGSELFVALRGEDWREAQAADVQKTMEAEDAHTWVAEVDGGSWGFATAVLPVGTDLVKSSWSLSIQAISVKAWEPR